MEALGLGLQALNVLSASRDFSRSQLSPEFLSNLGLITFCTLQQCRYSARLPWLCESWRAHLQTTFQAPAKANLFETSLLQEGKRAQKNN